MKDLESQIKRLRRLYVGNICNVYYPPYNLSGLVSFIGSSPLTLHNGKTYITITCDRFPIRVNRDKLELVKFQKIEMHGVNTS